MSLQEIQKHSRLSVFCFASAGALACRAIKSIIKGLLAQKKARKLFHRLLKSSTKTCYIQDTISNIYKHTTSNFLNPYGNVQGCENHVLTLSILTLFFMTGFQG